MLLPPERINIKRRRQDDPVETLLLEQAPGRDKKRRATDFLFRRLRADEIEGLPQPPHTTGDVSNIMQEKQRAASQDDNSGIPQIRTTLPGDEVKDMKAMKAAAKSQLEVSGAVRSEQNVGDHQSPDLHQDTAPSKTPRIKVPTNARRFHLSREHNNLGPSKHHGGVRKPTHRPKTHLATFVEKGLARMEQHSQMPAKAPPIDRIIGVKNSTGLDKSTPDVPNSAESQKEAVAKHTFERPFVKPPTNVSKKGQSIKTHPDTWDFDSDQLASELAAFAFELDPTGNNEPVPWQSTSDFGVITAESIVEDEFVYETYMRLPHNADIQAEIEQHNLTANIGVLIIAKEDEDLWEAYVESDEDDEWDEEDADSNAEDNPANDYPEDEVSSDDEFGLGAYNHRRNASDDEEYDLERDEWI